MLAWLLNLGFAGSPANTPPPPPPPATSLPGGSQRRGSIWEPSVALVIEAARLARAEIETLKAQQTVLRRQLKPRKDQPAFSLSQRARIRAALADLAGLRHGKEQQLVELVQKIEGFDKEAAEAVHALRQAQIAEKARLADIERRARAAQAAVAARAEERARLVAQAERARELETARVAAKAALLRQQEEEAAMGIALILANWD